MANNSALHLGNERERQGPCGPQAIDDQLLSSRTVGFAFERRFGQSKYGLLVLWPFGTDGWLQG